MEKTEIDVRDEILSHLESIERTMAWLSNKTGIAYATLYGCMIQRTFKVSDENLEKINTVLETSFPIQK